MIRIAAFWALKSLGCFVRDFQGIKVVHDNLDQQTLSCFQFSFLPWRMAHDSHPNWWNRNVGRLFTQLAKKRNSQANRRSSVGFIVHSKRRSLHHGRSAPVDSRSCSGRHLRTWSCSHARGQARMTCYARSGKHSTIHTLESTLHTLHTVTLYIPYSRLCPPLPLTSNSTPHSLL